MTFLKTTTFALAALALATTTTQAEIKYYTPDLNPFASLHIKNTIEENTIEPGNVEVAPFNLSSRVAVARMDNGQLIPTAHGEVVDWEFLDRRVETEFVQLTSTNYSRYIPETEFDAPDSDNKIDEIRMTAAGEGFDYVLIYGVGKDANWANFGGKSLKETGLTIDENCASWEQANAKALLINSHSGEVLGAATADNIEFHIGELADRVEVLVRGLAGDQI